MKIIKLWTEYENSSGEINLKPAIEDDLEYLGYRRIENTPKEAEDLRQGFPTWTPEPYTPEEIEQLKSKPGELKGTE